MINRPNTPQILRDLAEELNREIMPLLDDSTDQIRLFMITAVLGQCAVRADKEIALMKQETASYLTFAQDVADATHDANLATTIAQIHSSDDLHLEAVSAEYVRASEAFGLALEIAMDAGEDALVTRGEELLQTRIAHEQMMAGVASAGR